MLSVCIITKNEEKNIGRCLKALQGYGFEIVVVDTGSTDSTKEIASGYADVLCDYEWKDDFAAARNFAVSKASNETVMVVDADEFLEPLSKRELKSLYVQIAQHPGEVGRIHCKNYFCREFGRQESHELLKRIFSKADFYYEGSIHEQVVAKQGEEYRTYQTVLVFQHIGYDLPLKERREKAQRNIRLLKKERDKLLVDSKERGCEERLPYVLYQLGKSHFMYQDYERACLYFSESLTYDLNPRLEYVIDMVETYGYALLNSGQAAYARSFAGIYQEFGHSADFQFLMGLIYMNNVMFEEAIVEFKKAAGQKECRVRGVNSEAAWYNIGVIYECTGELEKAVQFYKKCGNYPQAQERLRGLKGRYK